MGAVIESSKGHDQQGLIWPEPLAPFSVVVTGTGELDKILPAAPGERTGYQRSRARAYEERLRSRRDSSSLTNLMRLDSNKTAKDANARLQAAFAGSEEVQDKMRDLWDWGEATTRAHVEHIALMLGGIPTLVDDVAIDDRYTLSDQARLADNARRGMPYVVAVGERFQREGLLEVRHRGSNVVEHMSLDKVVAMFSGAIPLEDRPEFNAEEHRRKLKFRMENAAMRKFNLEAEHKGDPDYFSIKHDDIQYDYNRIVDDGMLDEYAEAPDMDNLDEGNDEEAAAIKQEASGMKPLTEDPQQMPSMKSADKQAVESSFRKLEKEMDKSEESRFTESFKAPNAESSRFRGARLPADYYDVSAFEDYAPGKTKDQVVTANINRDPYANDWLRVLQAFRGSDCPSPSFDELNAFYRVGIVYEPKPGVVRLNQGLALANPHLLRAGSPVTLGYEDGLSSIAGARLNASRAPVRENAQVMGERAREALEDALKEPLNPAMTPEQVRVYKYEVYGIIEGDAETFDPYALSQQANEAKETPASAKAAAAPAAAKPASAAPAPPASKPKAKLAASAQQAAPAKRSIGLAKLGKRGYLTREERTARELEQIDPDFIRAGNVYRSLDRNDRDVRDQSGRITRMHEPMPEVAPIKIRPGALGSIMKDFEKELEKEREHQSKQETAKQ
jgi:hypothetical protein